MSLGPPALQMVSFNSVIAGDTSWAVALSLFRKSQDGRESTHKWFNGLNINLYSGLKQV